MVTSFRTAPRWKQSKCPSTDERLNKPWGLYTMGNYAAVKRNELLTCVTTWTALQGITLSEKVSATRLHTVRFHSCNILGMTTLQTWQTD